MYLLDSDHLTILWYDQGESYQALISRLYEMATVPMENGNRRDAR